MESCISAFSFWQNTRYLTKLFPLTETIAGEEAVFYHLKCSPSCKSSIRLSSSMFYIYSYHLGLSDTHVLEGVSLRSV